MKQTINYKDTKNKARTFANWVKLYQELYGSDNITTDEEVQSITIKS